MKVFSLSIIESIFIITIAKKSIPKHVRKSVLNTLNTSVFLY